MSNKGIDKEDILGIEQESMSVANAVPQQKPEGSQSFLYSLFNRFSSKQENKQNATETKEDKLNSQAISEETLNTNNFSTNARAEADSESHTVGASSDNVVDLQAQSATLTDDDALATTVTENSEEPIPEPIDAEVEIMLDNGKMSATICVASPKDGGEEISKEMLNTALENNGIVYGINENRLNEIVENKLYDKLYRIAEGTPPQDGADGDIIDYFPRTRELNFKTRDDGSIDFKSLNLINNVKKDVLICEATLPTEPVDGTDVQGNPIPGRKGKPATIPRGENTVLSEDKQKLYTGCEGNLVFLGGRFSVQKVFEVKGNVDNSIGNIDFSGDVIVRGDVYEGFTIKSQGNVTIIGMVEGASIYAQGSINISKGMNGMRKGVLESQKSITSKFLENCIIKAKESIQAESIINSTVFCEDELVVSGRKGAMIGGSFTVYKQIKAKVVGAPSNIPTIIMLGVTPELIKEKNELTKQINELKELDSGIEKNIIYLEKIAEIAPLKAERRTQLNQFKIQRPLNQMKQAQLEKRLQEINEIVDNVGKSRLTSNTVYPGTQITIGHITTIVQNTTSNCSFYLVDGEIKTSY